MNPLDHEPSSYDPIICHYCNKTMGYETIDHSCECDPDLEDRVCLKCWKKDAEAVAKLNKRQQDQIVRRRRRR